MNSPWFSTLCLLFVLLTCLIGQILAQNVSTSTTATTISAVENHLDPMQVEESQRNYLKQYLQPNIKSSRYGGGYDEYSIGNAYDGGHHMLVQLSQKGGGGGPDDQSDNDNQDEDTHYNPKYSTDDSKQEKKQKDNKYGNHKSYYPDDDTKGKNGNKDQDNGQNNRAGAGPSRYRYKPPEKRPEHEMTGWMRNKYNLGRQAKSQDSECVCQCPNGGTSQGHFVQRRSFYRQEDREEEPGMEPEENGDDQNPGEENGGGGGGGGHEYSKYNNGPDVTCNFAQTPCDFENDRYDDSLFRYGYNQHFGSKLWFIEQAKQQRGKSFQSKGWGRLISPHYEVPKYSGNDACMLIEFEFDSEGTDHLTVMIQENDSSRTILDYMHERPSEKESLLLRKFVHFIVTGHTIRFFVQFQFDTTIVDSEYGLRTFELFFSKCPHKDLYYNKPAEKAPLYSPFYHN